MNIIWKDIKGYEDLYAVSNTGLVKGKKYNRVLKPDINKGYVRVSLCKDGKTSKQFIHRLVASHFIPNPDNKPQVNHINGDKLTNTAINLEWVTCSENHKHAYQLGLKDPSKCCPKLGNNKGQTSEYMYVSRYTSDKEDSYRATISNSVNGKKTTMTRSFSVAKYGELEAEMLAAKAANMLIDTVPQFKNRPKNII